MWTFLIALAAFLGSALQMMVALVETREAHRSALAAARAESAQARKVPIWRRRRVRRALRSSRDAETEKSLALVDAVSLSWTMLMFASGAAALQALMSLV